MATREEAIATVKSIFGRYQRAMDYMPGFMGDGNGVVNTNRENYKWCRYPYSNSPAVPTLCLAANVPLVDNFKVVVGRLSYMPNQIQVLWPNDSRLDGVGASDNPVSNGSTAGYTSTASHSANHRYLSTDPVYINWRQITPLAVYPYSGLTVQIRSGYIPRPGGDVFIANQNLSLLSHVPVSGARYALISYDATGAVVVTDGAINAGGFAALTAADIPATPAGNWRTCAVVLYAGQTAIVENTSEIHIWDLRFPEQIPAGSVPTSSIPLANTHILVGGVDGLAHDVAMSSDATIANTGALTLKNTGPGATGPLGGATVAPIVTIDAQGRVTALSSTTITGVTPAAHQLDGALHTVSGLTPGYILTALTASTFGFAAAPTGAVPQVYNETLYADGINATYHLINYANPGTIRAYINGIRQPATDDASATDVVTFTSVPALGALLMFDYEMEIA